jgi:uncharacterized protein (DUF3820 family)
MVQLHGIGDTALLFVSLLDTRRHAMDPEDLQRLVTQKMPYGKYKDRLLADLPGHYLAWFAREGFPAGQLGRLLALMHEIDHNNLRELLAPLRDKRG